MVTRLAIQPTAAAVHFYEFLLEDCQLIFDVLDVTAHVGLHVDVVAAADLREALLDGLADFLGKLEGGDAVLQLLVRGVDVGDEDHFGLWRQHRLRKHLRQQRVVLLLEGSAEGGAEKRLRQAVK